MADVMAKLRTYRPEDIFNCDESGLFWKLAPDGSLGERTGKRVKLASLFIPAVILQGPKSSHYGLLQRQNHPAP